MDTNDNTAEDIIVGEWNLTKALDYVKFHAIDNDDYLAAENDAQVKFLNVSTRTLTRKFKGLLIPENAVFLFAAVLASAYNDTNKLQQQGVAGFSVKGISYTFKDWAKKGLEALIPEEVTDLISEENGIELSTRGAVKEVTL